MVIIQSTNQTFYESCRMAYQRNAFNEYATDVRK